jgi:hypothetical protein
VDDQITWIGDGKRPSICFGSRFDRFMNAIARLVIANHARSSDRIEKALIGLFAGWQAISEEGLKTLS